MYLFQFKMKEVDVATVALKISSAIEYMHSREPAVIHQDLKPLNVLVCLDTIVYPLLP